MTVDTHRRRVQQLRNEIATLETKRAAGMKAEADARGSASQAMNGITRNSSKATVDSRTRQARQHEQRADRERSKVVDLQKQVARKHTDLSSAEKALAAAENQLQKTQAQEAKRAADGHKRAADAERREISRSARSRELEVAALRGEVGQVRSELSIVRSALARELPAAATVLLLFADPDGGLRLDREMRAIHQALRLSEHRDHIRLEARWATRPGDISQAILDTRPTVVHFSGHGSQRAELVFEADDGGLRFIDPRDLVGLVCAIGESVRVIVYNACWSADAAAIMAERVEVAIGMDAPVTDEGARAFAEGFYRAVGGGVSVADAFEVGRFELRSTPAPRLEEAEPVLSARDGVDPKSVFLVAPKVDSS